tara:strand:+ start:5743 stop:6558 length:816 start_codon:yes stop_codon:yes gene_type:complete
MHNLQIYCLSLSPHHYNLIKKLGYIPVGLGEELFPKNWIEDKSGENISLKNPYYGEYTFHYWLWKNNKINFPGWIGFCQYRKFWKKNFNNQKINIFSDLDITILKEIPENIKDYETIIGEEIFINQFRFSKFLKKNLKTMLLNPTLLINKNKRTIKFHFDMMHGKGNLDKAINLLPQKDRNDFKDFVNTRVSFNPHNMFICKNKKILFSYYESLFPWLEECERIFGFEQLKGYGLKRIYGFLAERYMSYWFRKYTKFKILPIQFKELSDFL